MSVLGQVGCLPGRTIAFRKFILDDAMPAFLNARFLGVFLEVSDDRTLTNLCLQQGFRTVYQSTSCVYTDAPVGMQKLAKQQLRWARGSQYNTLRMLPWMMRNTPMLALFYVTDIVLPFLLLAAAHRLRLPGGQRREHQLLRGDHVRLRPGRRHGDHRRAHAAGDVDLRVRPPEPALRRAATRPLAAPGLHACSTRSCSCPSASTASCGWRGTTAGERDATRSKGDAQTSRANPLAAVPYLLAFAFVLIGVAYHG